MNLSNFVKQFQLVLFVLVCVSMSAYAAKPDLGGAPSGTYQVDLTHASVVWKVSHFGFSTYPGRFTDFTAQLNLDSEDFTKSSVVVEIQTDSISTSYPFPDQKDFDKKLSEDWLLSKEHPVMTFKSNSVSDLVDNKATVQGQLSMAGQTHPVSLDVTFNKGAAKHPFKQVPIVGFSATTKIDRTQWGVSKYTPNLGAELSIEIEGEFLQTAQ